MELIDKFLENDEKILWEYQYDYEDNLMEEISFGFFTSILILATGIIAPLIMIPLNIINNIIGILILIISFTSVGAPFLILSLIRMKIRCKITQLKPSQLKHYQDIFILTNKRWIQKSYRTNIKIKKALNKKKGFEKIHDIVFIELNTLNALTSEEIEYRNGKGIKKGFIVQLFLDFSYDYSKKSNLRVNIDNWQSYKDFLKKICDIIPLEKSGGKIAGPLGTIITFTPKK